MIYIGNPTPDLMPYVESCWSVFSKNESGLSFHEIFPDSNVKLVFRFSLTACRMVLMGSVSEKATVEIDGASDYFGFRFRPAQAPRLVAISTSELVDSYADIYEVNGESIRSLANRLLATSNHTERQQIMEDAVRGCLIPLVSDQRCRRASSLLDDHGGQLTIKELAGKVGIHVRSLERLFQAELGLSPKRMMRLIRVRKLMIQIHEGTFNTLADLAHACGYADQSHMIREFKQLTGHLPGEKGACEPSPLSGSPRTRIVYRYRP